MDNATQMCDHFGVNHNCHTLVNHDARGKHACRSDRGNTHASWHGHCGHGHAQGSDGAGNAAARANEINGGMAISMHVQETFGFGFTRPLTDWRGHARTNENHDFLLVWVAGAAG